MPDSANAISASVSSHVPSAAQRTIHVFGEELLFIQTGAETAGRFTHWLEITPPGGGPPPHYHAKEEEWFYVLKGQVSFYTEGEWKDAPPGSRVYMPRNLVHAFKNTGSEPLHMLITTVPAGIEDFMLSAAAEFNAPGGPDQGRMLAIATEHGIHFVDK